MNEMQKAALNKFFVQTFNKILSWEELSLAKNKFRDLSIKELHAIEAISELEQLRQNTMTNTAAMLSISIGALTTAINVLVRKGYVERKNNLHDRRIVMVSLTEKGREAESGHRAFHDEMIENIGRSLDQEKLDTLIDSLSQLSAFFESKIKFKELSS